MASIKKQKMKKVISKMISSISRRWENEEGVPHRVDGPAIERFDGLTMWYCNGALHRVDGPAIILPGHREEWWLNGRRHRVDGPAIEDNRGYNEWYLNGMYCFSEEEWFQALTEEDRLSYLFKMRSR